MVYMGKQRGFYEWSFLKEKCMCAACAVAVRRGKKIQAEAEKVGKGQTMHLWTILRCVLYLEHNRKVLNSC